MRFILSSIIVFLLNCSALYFSIREVSAFLIILSVVTCILSFYLLLAGTIANKKIREGGISIGSVEHGYGCLAAIQYVLMILWLIVYL